MKHAAHTFIILAGLLLVVVSHAATHVALPPVQYADTETATNVPFMMGANGRHTFASVTDTLPPWLHNPEWNIVRFTGRGTDELAESLVLSFNGTAFRFR